MSDGPSLTERVLTWSVLLLTAAVVGRAAPIWLKAWWKAVNNR